MSENIPPWGWSADAAAVRRRLGGVCLTPGTGEQSLSTTPIYRNSYETDNLHRDGSTVTDFVCAIGDLKRDFPAVKTVVLVVAWFGTDLRASQCLLQPGVDNPAKVTTPRAWAVADRVRSTAFAVSVDNLGSARFGGTPSDVSVVEAARYLKSQGLKVIFYPFMLMDIQVGNTLTNPYSGNAGQPAQPWRGQITTDRHRSLVGTTDGTAAARTHVTAFMGGTQASHITCSVNAATNAVTYAYTGPNEWRFRRQILHYAKLCAAINAVDPGAVTGFCMATEMVQLLNLRDGAGAYPGVEAFGTLLADVKGVVGASVGVTYAADWSEWNGWSPPEGGWNHHLDPLWAAADFVGIDNYMPISDWRPAGGTGGSVNSNDWMVYYVESWREHATLSGLISPPEGVDVILLFSVKPNMRYTGLGDWGDTGFEFQESPTVIRDRVAAARIGRPNLKILLTVGSGVYRDWSNVSTSDIVAFCDAMGLDGVDLDYEPVTPNCTTTGGVLSCASDAEAISLVDRFRAAFPRPKLVLFAGWSVGAFGEGIYANAQPPSFWTGTALNLLRSPSAAKLDAILVQSYNAGTNYSVQQAAEAYRAAWPGGRIIMGVETPYAAAGAVRATTAIAASTAASALSISPAGVFIYGLLEPVPPGNPTGRQLYEAARAVVKYPVTSVPGGLDAEGAGRSIYAMPYLRSQIEGGEQYDYFYANDGAKTTQTRSAITDAGGDVFQYRRKDLRGWWNSQHFNRSAGGVRAGSPTAWVPQSKPIIFTEFGCGKINSGTNQPNVFVDPNSVQGGYPAFSNRVPDARMQLSYFRAWLEHYRFGGPNNPVSAVYGGPMLDLDACCAWSYETRPFPEFPLDPDLGSDGARFITSHDINGNVVAGALEDLGNRIQVLWLGQSNAEKHFFAELGPDGTAQEPSVKVFARALAASLGTTSARVTQVRGAVGGTALIREMTIADPVGTTPRSWWWEPNANGGAGGPGPLATAALAAVQAISAPVKLMVWDQGETEGLNPGGTGNRPFNGGNNSGMWGYGCTVAQYQNAFAALVGWFRARLNLPTLPVLISGIGLAKYPFPMDALSGAFVPPVYNVTNPLIERAQRTAANTISNCFMGARRHRGEGDYGPEWPGDPALSTDGVHLFGGATGFGLQASRLAAQAAPIVLGTRGWTANSSGYSGPAREIVFAGNLNACTMVSEYLAGIASWSRSGNQLTITTNGPDNSFRTQDVGAQLRLQLNGPGGASGIITTIGTVLTNNQFRCANAGPNAAGTGGVVEVKRGVQIMKDIITTHKGWAAGDLSVTDWTVLGSILDSEIDGYRVAGGNNGNYGRWWNHTNGTPDLAGEVLGDWLALRGAAVKGIVLGLGEQEWFFRPNYSMTGKFQPRLKALIQYWRGRAGNAALPIWMIRGGGVYYLGNVFPMTELQAAQDALVADGSLGNVFNAAYAAGDPGGLPNVATKQEPTDGFSWTALGAQQVGQRLGDFIKTRIS